MGNIIKYGNESQKERIIDGINTVYGTASTIPVHVVTLVLNALKKADSTKLYHKCAKMLQDNLASTIEAESKRDDLVRKITCSGLCSDDDDMRRCIIRECRRFI